MVKRRRAIAVTIILVMLLSLAGCAADSNESAAKETVPTPTYVAEANRMAPPVSAADAFAGGSGTPENPYQIETAEQLALLAKYVNEANKDFSKAHYVQTADIVMNDTSNLDNWDKIAPEWAWTPIGIQYLNDFQGHYDGAGYSISGMYIYHVDDETDDPNTDINDIGLFGSVYEGVVKNVTLKDSYVYTAGVYAAGGMIGDASYSSVSNCTNKANVVTLDVYNVGGVCGNGGNETTFNNCHNTGTVYSEGANATGGICASARVSITNCTNTGDITANGSVGGICGQAPALVENCQNSGAIVNVKDNGMMHAGGIAGSSTKDIRNCHNFATVTGDGYVGGIVGSFRNTPALEEKTGNATLVQCVNEGTIVGQYEVGGITGTATIYNGDLIIRDCSNSGDISGFEDQGDVGGIAGDLSGMGEWTDGQGMLLENCRNTGSVTHLYNAGGIAGDCTVPNAPVVIQNCSNAGSISAVNGTGGILGQISSGNHSHTIRSCDNVGEIEAAGKGGGIVGMFLGFALDVEEPKEIQISKCVNRGEVSGKYIGGVVGSGMDANGTCRIEDCLNEGRIYGQEAAALGGILGVDTPTHGLVPGDHTVFYIERCVNTAPIVYGDGDLPFDTKIQYLKEFKSHINVDAATAVLLGGKTMGGIAGGVFRSVVEDCVNYGEIAAQKDVTFLVTLADFASFDTSGEGKTMCAGAICGMYYYNEDTYSVDSLGLRNCAYSDSACAGYSEFALFEGAHTITGVHPVSEDQARELANKLTEWRN